jgi:hypothetical protein
MPACRRKGQSYGRQGTQIFMMVKIKNDFFILKNLNHPENLRSITQQDYPIFNFFSKPSR